MVISNFSEHESHGLFIQLKFQGPHSLENDLVGEGFPGPTGTILCCSYMGRDLEVCVINTM